MTIRLRGDFGPPASAQPRGALRAGLTGIIALTTICAGLLLTAGGCAPAAPEAASATGATTYTIDTAALPTLAAGWVAFTEPGLGYTLQYPEDVMLTSGVSPAGVHTTRLQFRIPGVDGYQGMLIRAEPNPEGKGLEEVVQKLYDDYLLGEPPVDLLAQATQNIAGLTAAQIGAGGDFSLVVPIKDYVYIIAPVHDMATTSIDPQALALFYQILATLKVS